MDSNRHIRRCLTRPCRRCPFNISGACAWKRTLTGTNRHSGRQTDKQTAPNRHLGHKFLEIELLESKVSVRTPNRQLQTDTYPKIIRKAICVEVRFRIRAWLNSMSLCRKMVPNRHLQRGPKFNKKAYTKKGSSEVSVCILVDPVLENGT